jgi:hypothetical protein
MSAVDWVKLELHLGNVRYDDPLRLPERMSITTLAVLGDTSANRHRIYQLNKACSADIPGRGEFFSYEEVRPAALGGPWLSSRRTGVAARRGRHRLGRLDD